MTTRLDKPVRRLVKIRGAEYIIELAAGGILFRLKGGRRRHVVPMIEVLEAAFQHGLVQERREQLRKEVLQRRGMR